MTDDGAKNRAVDEPAAAPASAPSDGYADESFDDLYHRAPCGYLSTNSDGIITRINDTLLGWTGYSRDELVGTSFSELLDAGSRLFYETRHVPVLRLKGEVREVALTLRCADGEHLATLLNSLVIRDDAGAITSIRTAIFDATARQDYEHRLLASQRDAEESELRVRILQDASAAFGAADTEAELDEAIIASFSSAFDAPVVVLLGVDTDGMLRPKAGPTPLDQFLGDEPERPIAAAAMAGEIVAVGDPDQIESRFPAAASAMRAARYEALTATPLTHDGAIFGVVACLFRRQRSFSDQTVEVHAALGRQAAQVLARIRLQRQLEALALHDQLTGLANRTLLEEVINEAIESGRDAPKPLALIFVDLDGFKSVNDEAGHLVGDLVLQEVASRLLASVRHSDTVGRLGGDEFLIVCDDADDDAARSIGQRILTSIRQPLLIPANPHFVSASIGIAVRPASSADTVTAARMIALADAGMYRSKQSGKDRLTVVDA